ncbi:hypothetical protein F4779DRAFT_352516 [Xylariaceae sp. FL0662B]|nr:hypothetical protein F4779DRAFT_352516 [Xylariaceae sp. FL0662B]
MCFGCDEDYDDPRREEAPGLQEKAVGIHKEEGTWRQHREEAEKVRRQAPAANTYGWGGQPQNNQRQRSQHAHVQKEKRNSSNDVSEAYQIHGSEMATFDPNRPRHTSRSHHRQSQPRYPEPARPKQAYHRSRRQDPVLQRSQYRTQVPQRKPVANTYERQHSDNSRRKVVCQQPPIIAAMLAHPGPPQKNVRRPPHVVRTPHVVQQHPAAAMPAWRPVIQTAQPHSRFVRRDSNGVSECSSDDDDDNWRHHPVSPSPGSPGPGWPRPNLHNRVGIKPSRGGAF